MSTGALPVLETEAAPVPVPVERVNIGRRRFFAAATAVSASALASACGDGFIDGPPTVAPTPGAPIHVDPRAFAKLARVGGVAVIRQDGFSPIALTRTGEQSYSAVSLLCPHKGTAVNPTDAGFTCPNHGAQFSPDGSWAAGKETGDLTVLGVTLEADGTLTIGGVSAPLPSPAIMVAPSAEVFTYVRGGAAPASQLLTISNSGGGTLNAVGFTIGHAASEPGGWLTGELSSSVAPSIVTLSVNASALATLAAGIYTSTVQVSSSTATNGPVPIPVTLIVMDAAAPPQVLLSPAVISFATTEGVQPAAQTIQVMNAGGGTLEGIAVGSTQYISDARGWVTTTVTAAAAPTTVAVSVDVASLAPGTYMAALPVTGTGGRTQGATVTVVLIVEPRRTLPSIALSPRQLAFALAPDDSTVPPQSVNITNSGAGALTALSVGAITYGSTAADWLAASIDTTTTPPALRVSVRPATLVEGSHTAYVPVRATGATNSPQEVAVTCVVSPRSAPPEIGLSASALAFAAVEGSDALPSQIAITNTVAGTLLTGISVGSVVYGAGATGWLAGTLSATTAPCTLTVTPTTAALPPGAYSAELLIVSAGADNSPQHIAVSLVVSQRGAPPAISLSTGNIAFATVAGSAIAPQTLTVQNAGAGTLAGLSLATIDYGAGASGWLAAALSAPNAPATITLTAASSGLAPGFYTATLTVTSSLSGVAPRAVNVTLTITAGPTLQLSTSAITFAAAQGGSPSPQNVTLTNSGGGILGGLALGSVTYGPGATGWLSAALSGNSAPANVVLTPSTTTLSPGTYTASVTLSATGAQGSPRTIAISLTISAAPTITLSTLAANFSASQGASPPSQFITVTNGGGGVLSGIATGAVVYGAGAQGWLTVTGTGATAPATLTLTVSSNTLAAGSYTASFAVSATGATARTVAVTLDVAAAGAIALSISSAAFASATGGTPAPQTVNVTNSGAGTISGLAITTVYGAGASGWLSASSLSAQTAPAVLTLRVSTSGLGAGAYSASVQVTGAQVAPRTLTVTLTITAAGLAVIIANWPALATVGGAAGSVGNVGGTPTAVVRTGANSFAAYSMRCPHQGTTCRIENWKNSGSVFHCPNHDALFDRTGLNMPGSPQRTTNLTARTVSYAPGDTVLYLS